MSDLVLVLLCVALVAMSVSSAVSVFFVCKLVDRVAKLNASPDPQTYRSLVKTDEVFHATPVEEDEPSGATGNDGTLTDASLEALGKLI